MSIAVKQFVIGAAGSATAAGDVAASAGVLRFDLADSNITGIVPANLRSFPIVLAGVSGGMYQAGAAEVLRVITITPTAVNSTDYRIILSAEKGQDFNNNLPNETQTAFYHTTPVSGGTPTTISAAFIAAINAHPFWSTRVTASGTTTIVLTAKAGYPIFSAAGGANLVTVVTTPGVIQFGATGAQLLANGFPFSADSGVPVAGTNYDLFTFEIGQPSETVLSPAADHRIVFAVVPGGNNATFITTLAGLLTK